ncbi:restriction endonuclease subunit S [Patescibacteria group bacterium]|nr:restriction endonuclease subunit S [Patescibacteria group bacterium]MBU1473126.1 restriction endonuclease subunit S [Patescibacteria group bacterium]MBU2459662.1 restriction endonuclease subunit S [Patescibacteria group bacterium]MBU2544236.1 restriction endonuclease subunit S [Patescibacteria group bacterium]
MVYSIIQKSQLEGARRLDAEYYQPEYLHLVNDLVRTHSYKSWNGIKGKFTTGPFGSEFNVENYVTEGKYRYIRGKDVKEFIIADNDNVYIPEKDFERLKKYSLDEGDILISVVGTLGNVAIVDKYSLPAIFSCKSTVFRTDSINPHYLISYLNSKYGKNLLLRCMRGHIQVGLNIDDLKYLLIFIPPKGKQEEIGRLFLKSQESLSESKRVYVRAEKLLLDELGLADFQFSEDLTFEVNFSDVKNFNRMDADYFQPKYQLIVDKIIKKKRMLGIAKRIKNTVKPTPDIEYNYIEISNVNAGNGEVTFNRILGKELPANAKIGLSGNELIISKVRPTRGAIAIIPQEFSDNFIASGAFSVFNVGYPMREYLQVVFRSVVGKLQLERPTTGTSYPTITDEDIENTWVPDLSLDIQQKIADLVQQSYEARKKSKELLEEAKRKVEEMIEKGMKHS